MLTIRCTQRLLKAFRIKVIDEETPSTTRLGDWYANLIGTTCGNRILCVSDRSLLAVVLGEREWRINVGWLTGEITLDETESKR